MDEAEPMAACASENGYGLELTGFTSPGLWNDENGVREVLSAYQGMLKGFTGFLSLHGPFIDVFLHSSEAPVRRFAERTVRRSIEIGLTLGVQRFVFHIGLNPLVPVPEYAGMVVEAHARFWSEILREFPDVLVCLENSWEPGPETQMEIIRQCGHERLVPCLDVSHVFVYSRQPLGLWVEAFGSKPVHLHLNDTSGSIDDHRPIGQGIIKWEEAVPLIVSSNINQKFVLELNRFEDHLASLEALKNKGLLAGG